MSTPTMTSEAVAQEPVLEKVRITDSTLRDGSHAMAHRFTEAQVRSVVNALDQAGVEIIEVTHGDGLGGSSFNYGFSAVDDIQLVAAAVDEARQARIAVLMLPGLGLSLIHISEPTRLLSISYAVFCLKKKKKTKKQTSGNKK